METGLGPLIDEETDPAVPPVAVARDFGDYELGEEIGRGGQGVVYRAHQKSLNRTVALKIIALGHWATEAHLKRFRREAEAAAGLDHPQIVPIYEIGERDGACYFSMKCVEGGPLDEVVRQNPITIRRAAELIVKLARTIHYAHERGILHRDIKPGNILIDAQGEPHLTDFGLARPLETESTVTGTAEVLGTPSYMAPEQARGQNAVLTAATDVYALGAVFYQLLTGRPPFTGRTSYETVQRLLETDPRPPRLVNPKVDRDLSTICLKCLEKDPPRRYATAADLAEDLEHWLRHEPIRARPAGLASRGKKWLRRNPATAVATLSLAALALTASAIFYRGQSLHPPSPAGIALLPFESRSDNKENAYFAAGIQDDILARLSRIGSLKVISRTSTERFKSRSVSLSEIGKQLEVSHLLEGSVQKAGDEIQITVQLVNASTGAHVWAEAYDRKLTDIFSVESEIAQRIAFALEAKLTGSEQRAIAARPTQNTKAYQLYLKGRFFLNKRMGSDLVTAADYFQQAITADSGYAGAYAGLAQANLLLPLYRPGVMQELLPKARAAATRAIELDETSSEGHAVLAMLRCVDFQFGDSEAEFKRAVQLDPNYATAHHWYGADLLARLGRFDEAIAQVERAIDLDPVSLIVNADLGTTFFMARRYDEAIVQLNRTLALDEHFAYARWTLGSALYARGEVNAAIIEYEKARAIDEHSLPLVLLGRAYAETGRTAEAMEILQKLKEMEEEQTVSGYVYALIYIGLGEQATALDYLENCSDMANMGWLKVDPRLDPLRKEPRFQRLVAKFFPQTAP